MSTTTQIAAQIIYRTPSEKEAIICYDISQNEVFYISKGQYGGYIVKPPRDLSNVICFYCVRHDVTREFTLDENSLSDIRSAVPEEIYSIIAQFRSRLIEYGVEEHLINTYTGVRIVEYTYVPVSLSIKKQNERYIVVDIVPTGNELRARAVHIYASRWRSRRGKVHGYEDFSKFELAAKQFQLEAYVSKENTRVEECRVKIVLDASQLEQYIASKLGLQVTPSQVAKLMPTATIPLRFFIVSYELPSEGRLNIYVDEVFRNIKVGEKIIKIVRGYFYNKLKYLRAKFYEVLNEYTINVGFFRLLPISRAQDFMNKVNEIRKEFEEFEKQLKDFLLYGKKPHNISRQAVIDEEYTKLIREYAKQHGIDIESKIKSISIVDGFYVKLIPVVLDVSQFAELDPQLREEIEKLRSETVERVRRELETRAREIIEQLVKKLERLTILDVKNAKHEVDQLLATARELHVDVPILHKLSELLSEPTPEKISQIKAELKSGRVKALLELI